jgi:hypothetical protein
MGTYKVDVEHAKKALHKMQVTITADAVHVIAATRETAVHKAFDELHDRGFNVTHVGDVSLYDEKSETWHVIPSHRQLSKATV